MDLTECEGLRKCDATIRPLGGWWTLHVPKVGLQDTLFSGHIKPEFTPFFPILGILFLMIFFFSFEVYFPFPGASSVFLFEICVTMEMSWHSIVAFTSEV